MTSARQPHAVHPNSARKIKNRAPFCTPNDMFPKGLSTEARERFAHHIDHRPGHPAVPPIVEEGEGENLTIYRRDVPSQCDDLIGSTRLRVQVSLGGRIPHSASPGAPSRRRRAGTSGATDPTKRGGRSSAVVFETVESAGPGWTIRCHRQTPNALYPRRLCRRRSCREVAWRWRRCPSHPGRVRGPRS